MNSPIVLCERNFQEAWREVCIILSESKWELWDVIVEIKCPLEIDQHYHELVTKFAKQHDLIKPKDVAYTIFPYGFYSQEQGTGKLYKNYWRFFKYTRNKAHSGWGTYFERMIRYPSESGNVDQLGKIINSIRESERISRAAYTMIIPKPGYENIRPLGAPCLNYIAIRTEPAISGRVINLLAVYRNHDFLERAYGNYFGLCKLMEYIAIETGSEIGNLTCISSHAYVPGTRTDLKHFIENSYNYGAAHE